MGIRLGLVGAEEPDDAGLCGSVDRGQLPGQVSAGGKAIGRSPVHVNLDRACATLGEGRNQGLALVVLDRVGQDAFGLGVGPAAIFVIRKETAGASGLNDCR